jgi:hypothetical protein
MILGSSYKIGDSAIIIKNICGHGFKMGEIVKIIDTSGHQNYFQASNGKEVWYLSIDEMAPYESLINNVLDLVTSIN